MALDVLCLNLGAWMKSNGSGFVLYIQMVQNISLWLFLFLTSLKVRFENYRSFFRQYQIDCEHFDFKSNITILIYNTIHFCQFVIISFAWAMKLKIGKWSKIFEHFVQ